MKKNMHILPLGLLVSVLFISQSNFADPVAHVRGGQQSESEDPSALRTVASMLRLADARPANFAQKRDAEIDPAPAQPVSFQGLEFTIDGINNNKARKNDLIELAKTKLTSDDPVTVSAFLHLMQTFPDAAADLADEGMKHKNINEIVKQVISLNAQKPSFLSDVACQFKIPVGIPSFACAHAAKYDDPNRESTTTELVSKYVLWPTLNRMFVGLKSNLQTIIGNESFLLGLYDHNRKEIARVIIPYGKKLEGLRKQYHDDDEFEAAEQQLYEDKWETDETVQKLGSKLLYGTQPVDLDIVKALKTHPRHLINSAIATNIYEQALSYADQATEESIRLPEYSWKQDNKYSYIGGKVAKFVAETYATNLITDGVAIATNYVLPTEEYGY